MLTVLTFNLLLKIKLKSDNKFLKTTFREMSEATFGAYLLSWIYDTIIYGKLNGKILLMRDKFAWYVAIVIVVYTLSIISGIIINKIYSFTCNKISEARVKIFRNKNAK